MTKQAKTFTSMKEFYPFYLKEHSNRINRRLHFIGTTLALALLVWSLVDHHYARLWFCLLVGYGFAWIGHFFIEKNRPATFKYPLFSFLSDFRMYKDILIGKVSI